METVLLLEQACRHPPLRDALRELGYRVVGELSEPRALQSAVMRLSPDVIVVTTEAPSEEMLANLASIAASCPRPVILFAHAATRGLIRKAVDSGVCAYVVDGWAPGRLTAIIEAACARFDAFEEMRKELARTRAKLGERKLVEKAKGIVMQQRKLSEEQAFRALRKMAMDQNLALAEVARRVIAVAQLLA